MSDLQLIETALKRASRRRWLERIWRRLWLGLLAGGLIWLAVYGCYKLFPLPSWALLAGASAGGFVCLALLVLAAVRKASLQETARWVDERQQLQERLSTALELSANTQDKNWTWLVLRDAARHAKDVDARRLLPFRLPVAGRWALLVLLLGATLGFVPEYRSKAYVQRLRESMHVRETGRQLAGFTRQNLQQRPPALVPAQKALEKVAEAGEVLSKTTLTRSEALRDLASLNEKLEQQARELGKDPAIKPLERAARDSDGTTSNQTPEALQKQIEALKEKLGKSGDQPSALDKAKRALEKAQQALANLGDPDSPGAKAAREKLAQSLSELSQQMRDLGVSMPDLENALKALEKNQTDLVVRNLQSALQDLDKLRQMAKDLQQMQQQNARTGKDLGEQLERGQAAVARQTLQKMIDQLRSGKLTSEQLQKMQQEISKAIQPGSKYGKVGEHLKNAAGQCRPGQESEAAKSLAQAAKELENLAQQLSDMNSLIEAMDAVERAQMAIASGKDWSECQGSKTCLACNGKGCARCKGKGWSHGKGFGAGVGTWADETGWTALPDAQVPVDNSDVVRPDMDPRGQSDRDAIVNPNLTPTKVRGQISPGAPLPSITLKGVSIKGQSSLEYEQAATAAQSDAENALNQDKVPRAYQDSVRDYFDDLKK